MQCSLLGGVEGNGGASEKVRIRAVGGARRARSPSSTPSLDSGHRAHPSLTLCSPYSCSPAQSLALYTGHTSSRAPPGSHLDPAQPPAAGRPKLECRPRLPRPKLYLERKDADLVQVSHATRLRHLHRIAAVRARRRVRHARLAILADQERVLLLQELHTPLLVQEPARTEFVVESVTVLAN